MGYDAYNLQFGMPSWAIVNETATPVWDVSKSGNYKLEGEAVAAAAAPAETAAPAPAALPTTGMALGSLLLAGLGLTGAGLALRRR